jgi:hypothetical protein
MTRYAIALAALMVAAPARALDYDWLQTDPQRQSELDEIVRRGQDQLRQEKRDRIRQEQERVDAERRHREMMNELRLQRLDRW